jgi:hypothetical protein
LTPAGYPPRPVMGKQRPVWAHSNSPLTSRLPIHRRQRSARGRGNPLVRATQMLSRLPDVPDLRCDDCGCYRFLPLIFPRSVAPRGGNRPTRPSAKCVDCGLSYVELKGSNAPLRHATRSTWVRRRDWRALFRKKPGRSDTRNAEMRGVINGCRRDTSEERTEGLDPAEDH